MLRSALLVMLGGGLGSLLRYLVSLGAAALVGLGFPFATLTVNVVGSFLLALLFQAMPGAHGQAAELKLALGTGVLGGFTTYSTFNLEVLALAEQGAVGKAAVYAALTLALCLGAGAAGWALGRAL